MLLLTPHPPIPKVFVPLPHNTRCPGPPGTPRPGDYNGDGKTDWKYGGDIQVPAPGFHRNAGWVGIDNDPPGSGGNDRFRAGIFTDTDYDGVIDPGEPVKWIGECPYNNSDVQGNVKFVNGFMVSEITIYDKDDAHPKDRNGRWITFYYDEATNNLVVVERLSNGNTSFYWTGPPGSFPWGTGYVAP